MTEQTQFILSDERRPRPGQHPKHIPTTPEPYIAADELVTAVNLAIYLHRPLLLEGDAGCGKSRLARYVAYKLGLPLYEWAVSSTSRARDGLYVYDSILRLHDVHLRQFTGRSTETTEMPNASPATTARQRDPEKSMDYVNFGALGKAFQCDCSAVVLIDEIDKADIDFPNDLLTVLDDPWKFKIHEAEEFEVKAVHPPIVIITSNEEKRNLPEPFLRRCVYFYIEFPADSQRLKEIVDAHYVLRNVEPPATDLIEGACDRFLKVRKEELHKKPGTSEFLDWLEALRGFRDLTGVVESLGLDGARLPYPELLFKIREDWRRHAATP